MFVPFLFQASRYGLKVIAVEIDSERAEQGKLRPDAREAGKELSRRGQFSSSIARTRNLGGIDHGDLEVSLNYKMKQAPPSSTQFLLFATCCWK